MKYQTAFWLDVNEHPENGGAANVATFGLFAPGEIMEGFRRYKIYFEIPDAKSPDDFAQPTMQRIK